MPRRCGPLSQELGLTGAALENWPAVRLHNADLPRVAIYSQWSGTQNLGWYRLTFDAFRRSATT